MTDAGHNHTHGAHGHHDHAPTPPATGWHRFTPGHSTDIIWTIPPLLYALAVRLGRAPATAT